MEPWIQKQYNVKKLHGGSEVTGVFKTCAKDGPIKLGCWNQN